MYTYEQGCRLDQMKGRIRLKKIWLDVIGSDRKTTAGVCLWKRHGRSRHMEVVDESSRPKIVGGEGV